MCLDPYLLRENYLGKSGQCSGDRRQKLHQTVLRGSTLPYCRARAGATISAGADGGSIGWASQGDSGRPRAPLHVQLERIGEAAGGESTV